MLILFVEECGIFARESCACAVSNIPVDLKEFFGVLCKNISMICDSRRSQPQQLRGRASSLSWNINHSGKYVLSFYKMCDSKHSNNSKQQQ